MTTNWCPPSPPATPRPSSGTAGNLYPISPSTLCNMGWRPIMLTGMIRNLMTAHFKDQSQIEDADLRHLVWRPDERTGILIESIHRWRGTIVEKRPAVVVKLNARQNIRLGIQDKVGTDEQGNINYQTFWVGSHTLFCIHGSGASAEILATEVQRELTQWHPVIVNSLKLYQWQVTEVGAISEIEEAKETFVIPVTVAWTYTEMWKVSQEALKLRYMPLEILLDGALVTE